MNQCCNTSVGVAVAGSVPPAGRFPAPKHELALYAADGSGEHIPARMLHREPGFYRLSVTRPIRPGMRLVMVDGPFRFEVTVHGECPSVDNRIVIECHVLACREGTLRQEWRMQVNVKATLTVPLTGEIHRARIHDTSPFGMGLEIPVPLIAGTAVIVDTKDGFGYGEVRHCRSFGAGTYFVGLYLREYLSNPASGFRTKLSEVTAPVGKLLRVCGSTLRSRLALRF